MSDIVNADFDQDNLEEHQKIAANLNTEIKTIFSSCTMKGQAHIQLHNYILPLVNLCEQYKQIETTEEAKDLNEKIKTKLSEYFTYFN